MPCAMQNYAFNYCSGARYFMVNWISRIPCARKFYSHSPCACGNRNFIKSYTWRVTIRNVTKINTP